jgi:hypothetical protein
MRLRVHDPACVDDLSAFLQTRVGAIVDRTALDELEVSLIGSFSATAMREELKAALLHWRLVRQAQSTVVELE